MYAVLFVCTGNICRSPMAEYLLRHRLGRDPDWNVGSAGTMAGRGLPASAAAVGVMDERGIDIRTHRSRPAEQDLVDAADCVVVMTAAHREQLLMLFPEHARKMFLLKSFAAGERDSDIEDPIGLSTPVYRDVRDQIDAALPGLVDFVKRFGPKWRR